MLSKILNAMKNNPLHPIIALVSVAVGLYIWSSGLPTLLVSVVAGVAFFLVMLAVFRVAKEAEVAVFMQEYTTRDIVYMGFLIAIGGVFKAYWGQARLLIESLIGPYAVFVVGPGFLVWAILACHLVRRPFSGTISMVLGGVVEILFGNPFGLPVLLFNFWEGLGPDISYNFIFRNKRYDIWAAFTGGVLTALFGLWYSWVYFGFSELPPWAFIVYVAETILGGYITAVVAYGAIGLLEPIGVKPSKPATVQQ